MLYIHVVVYYVAVHSTEHSCAFIMLLVFFMHSYWCPYCWWVIPLIRGSIFNLNFFTILNSIFFLDSFSVNFVLNFLNVKFYFILKNFPKWKWLFFVVLKNDLFIIQCFFIDPNIFLNIWILNPEFEILFFTFFLYSSLYSLMLIMFKIHLSVCQFVNVFVMFYFPFCLYTKCILYVKDWKFKFELVVCEFVVCMSWFA